MKYFELLRPGTAIPPIFAVVLGAFIAVFSLGLHNYSVQAIILASISMASAQIFGQVSNQLTDPRELDLINGKRRPLVKGEISPNQAGVITVATLLLSFFTATLVNVRFLIVMLAILFFVFIYNFEPVRLKKRFLLNNLVLGISRGFLPFLASWLVVGSPTQETYIYSVGLFLWVFIWQTTKDIPDVMGDRTFDINTIPVKIGVEKTILFLYYGSWAFLAYHAALFIFYSKFIYLMLFISFWIFISWIFNVYEVKDKLFLWRMFYYGIVLYYAVLFLVSGGFF